MDFSDALKALRKGASIAREGWNGKGMFVFLATTASYATPFIPEIGANEALLYALRGTVQADLLPAIFMRDAQGHIVTGWLASQTDLLSDDWVVVHRVP